MDEIRASGRIPLESGQESWLDEKGVALLLPLVARTDMEGFIAIGSKTDGEDFTTTELELLHSLSGQIALTAENNILIEDKLEKERLMEQLSLARSIQEGLLPEEIPHRPGLELAARIRFCLSVAGDYYDVIDMGDGRTALAIGDVSGKGVGAALLMANLQASLRTILRTDLTLPEMVTRINTLLYSTIPQGMFITFFLAVYDPGKRELRYVDAGHNPPLILRRSSCSVEILAEGGLLLGITRDTEYAEGILEVAEGDLLFLYTDGVSEAMDENGEEFGEKRIAAFMEEHCASSLEAMVSGLESEILEYRGTESFDDDFTVLSVRFTGEEGTTDTG
jgi:sigma-B regulation protein RsbU (phosphoserine phosphatase)